MNPEWRTSAVSGFLFKRMHLLLIKVLDNLANFK